MNRRFLEQRVSETLDLAYEIHWPYQQRTSARGLRRSPLHDRVEAAGAVFGELLAGSGPTGTPRPGWPRATSTLRQAELVRALGRRAPRRARAGRACSTHPRSASSLVQGRDAEAVLQRVCANNVAVQPGRIVYTQWLNERGGIEADVTVTRLASGGSWSCPGRPRSAATMTGCSAASVTDEFVTVTDISTSLAMIPVMGPDRAAAAPAADRRRPVQRGVPVRHLPRDRPRLRVRPRHPDHLRRRTRLGTAHPGRPGRARLRHADRGRRRARPAARRLPRARLAAAGEGVPQLGT